MKKNSNEDNENQKNLIFGKYKLTKIIGCGSFGYVYEGINILDNNSVAVKVEKKESGLNLLEKESFYLYNLRGIGVPEVISFGYSGKYNILVQSLLGKSLGSIFYKNNNYFSLKDICMLSIQILHRIEHVHSKFIIHRDIKPENFLIGEPDKYLIYIIDFGLSKKYKSSRTNKHIQFQLTKKFTGTARYASLNAIRGAEQSRRDDLEAIGYMILYFFNNGKLPWQGVSCKGKAEKYVKIFSMKKNLDLEEFCKFMPKEIITYMDYCRKLEFEQKPDYDYLRSLFENALKSQGINNDLQFSWIKDTSILKNYHNIKNKITPIYSLVKRKESPQSRLFKKLESSKELTKEKENETEKDIKSLKTNNSLESIHNINILRSQAQSPQFKIHKRYKSTGDNTLLKNKDSENFKSGVAQYNISIKDGEPQQIIDKAKELINKNVEINSIKENQNKKEDISSNKNIEKNNLYYFSGNVNELCKNWIMKKMTQNKQNNSRIEQNKTNDYEIKKQNSSFFMNNKLFSLNSITKNHKYIILSPNIIKSLSYIRKIKPKAEENKENISANILKNDNENNNTQKYQKNSTTQNTSFSKINNSKDNCQILKNRYNFKNKFKSLKINYIKKNIKKQNISANINKSNIFEKQSINNNDNSKFQQNTLVNQIKTKKIDNALKKDKKRKIIKMKVKNIPNINIQMPSNNLNCKSAANIFKNNTSPNNLQNNLKFSFIQNINNKRLKKENLIKTENLSNNLTINNNIEGKLNKIHSMKINNINNKKKDSICIYKKITPQEFFDNSKSNINTNKIDYDILKINQTRINKYKNIRYKISKKLNNFITQKSMTKINDISMQKSPISNGTINNTINNCHTGNNTINSNNNNNTIISIYNNFNICKNNNRYGFIHKKIDNITLDTLNNINKGKFKNNNSSYNGYKLKLNNYKSYIKLNPIKSTTLLKMPSFNQNSNYTTLNSRFNNDSNYYNSQMMSNKDIPWQEYAPNKKMFNYFSLNNQKKGINDFKKNKEMNLSSSRMNLNSYKIKKIFNELNKEEPKIKRIERNKTENVLNLKNISREKENEKFEHSCGVIRSNSFLYGSSNFFNVNLENKFNINNLDFNNPSINRKNTEIFCQGLSNFKMNYNIYDSNINTNKNKEETFKNHRTQSRDNFNYNNKAHKNFDFFS